MKRAEERSTQQRERETDRVGASLACSCDLHANAVAAASAVVSFVACLFPPVVFMLFLQSSHLISLHVCIPVLLLLL